MKVLAMLMTTEGERGKLRPFNGKTEKIDISDFFIPVKRDLLQVRRRDVIIASGQIQIHKGKRTLYGSEEIIFPEGFTFCANNNSDHCPFVLLSESTIVTIKKWFTAEPGEIIQPGSRIYISACEVQQQHFVKEEHRFFTFTI